MLLNNSTVVVGVDPAPSKGLCVYAYNPQDASNTNAGFDRHYKATCGALALREFSQKVNELAEAHSVLICWDAPLTMPANFNEREIERKAKPKKPDKMNKDEWASAKRNLASVLPAAGCSHWVITQKVLGFPGFDNKQLGNALLNAKLIFDTSEIKSPGIFATEVHPALAIQIALGQDTIDELDKGGKLSGTGWSYKGVEWNLKGPSDHSKCQQFQDLLNRVIAKFKRDEALAVFPKEVKEWRKSEEHRELDPSDHLDAWVAMQLGMLWLKGENVKCYGNPKIGSFLLPSKETAAGTEQDILTNIERQ